MLELESSSMAENAKKTNAKTSSGKASDKPSGKSSGKSSGPTPMIAQYLTVKADYPHALLFYRMGDFYEMFFQDAEVAAKSLNLTLTKRGQLDGVDIAMCGVPVHAMDNYLARLIRQGFKVAICEQSEDPETFKKKGGKGPLPRAVVRLVTPGTLNEDGLLAPDLNNYLAVIGQSGGQIALAWADMSTGSFYVQHAQKEALEAQIARLQPAELIWSSSLTDHQLDAFCTLHDITASLQPAEDFDSQTAHDKLQDFYQDGDNASSLQGISRAMLSAAGALITYLQKTQISTMPRLAPLAVVHDDGIMEIDPATRRSLELTRTTSHERKGSLLDAIDYTQSAAGARLLATRLSAPLTNKAKINERLDLAQIFVDDDHFGSDIGALIKPLPDCERCLSRLSIGRGGPRDLISLRHVFAISREINLALHGFANGPASQIYGPDFSNRLMALADVIASPSDLYHPLQNALADDVPLLARDGGFVRQGFDARLDELLSLRDESRRLIAMLQSDYCAKTNIASLKVKHNNVLGYHIDVRANHAEILMNDDEFIHRQTTAQSVRFTTTKLAELERDISSAGDKALALEMSIFQSLVSQVTTRAEDISQAAMALAELDVAVATGRLALLHHYCRPQLHEDTRFHIEKGRHPVVEQALSADTPFMANDCHMTDTQSLWLLTGPNMAGKSTFLRQNALITIIAQAGLFVPAMRAEIGIVDKCFSRVGASDDLARGQSTFMVEMVETATILNQATDRSLVILDEIGRGTATYDGLAIAHACLEYLHETNGCRTLFATHYHELTSLEDRLARLYCCSMLVKEWQNDIIFLHQVGQGAANRSYGVHVAKLAGLPDAVIARAEMILANLEQHQAYGEDKQGGLDPKGPAQKEWAKQTLGDLPLFEAAPVMVQKPHEIIEALQHINADDLTARQALDLIYDLMALLPKDANAKDAK